MYSNIKHALSQKIHISLLYVSHIIMSSQQLNITHRENVILPVTSLDMGERLQIYWET